MAAAAEPLGDATLLWRAAGVLGIGANAAHAAETAGLIKFGARVGFRHPLVRAAAYRSASPEERQEIHRALAEVTDAEVDPDRRAWHRAQATLAPDEVIAAELEQSAARAQSRGGLLAAAALLERAASLTPEPAGRAERELAAAWRKRDGGALDAALALLAAVESGPADAMRSAEVKHLRGQIMFDQRRAAGAAPLLLDAAGRLESLNCDLARETYLDALAAAIWASGTDTPEVANVVAAAARVGPPPRGAPRVIDWILDALASRFTDGHATAAASLARALTAVQSIDCGAEDVGRLLRLGGNRVTAILATELWDFEAGRALAELQVRRARDAGALVQLQFAVNVLATNRLLAGELTEAAELVEEDRMVADITGNPAIGPRRSMVTGPRADRHLRRLRNLGAGQQPGASRGRTAGRARGLRPRCRRRIPDDGGLGARGGGLPHRRCKAGSGSASADVGARSCHAHLLGVGYRSSASGVAG